MVQCDTSTRGEKHYSIGNCRKEMNRAESSNYPMKQNESIEQELRLAKEYWLRTVQPHIEGRRLRDVELFVAKDAHLRLRGSQRKAEDWNRTQEGRLSPLDVDLPGEKFREPEVLFADENLKPEILAEIAAPLINKSEAKVSPTEAVRNAHEL